MGKTLYKIGTDCPPDQALKWLKEIREQLARIEAVYNRETHDDWPQRVGEMYGLSKTVDIKLSIMFPQTEGK